MRDLLGGRVHGDDDFVLALTREGFQHFIPFHHGQRGSLPMRMADGVEVAKDFSITAPIWLVSESRSIKWCSMPITSRIGSMILTPYFLDLVGATSGSLPSRPTTMQTGKWPSTATPRMALIESRKPVYCIMNTDLCPEA